MEGAAGEPFLAFMEREVIDALDMRHTIAEHMDVIIPNRVRYYARREDGRLRNAPYVDTSNKWAGGGYLSTPADLVRFGIDHLEARLLRPETGELLMQPHLPCSHGFPLRGLGRAGAAICPKLPGKANQNTTGNAKSSSMQLFLIRVAN